MKKFRLQAVLEYRRSLEEETQGEFFAIRDKLAYEMELLSEIRHQIADWQRRLQEKQRQGICPAEIDFHHTFLHFLTGEGERQREKIQTLESALEEKRQELLRVTREKKVIETLKEKALIVQEQEMLRLEQKISDEKAANRGHILDER